MVTDTELVDNEGVGAEFGPGLLDCDAARAQEAALAEAAATRDAAAGCDGGALVEGAAAGGRGVEEEATEEGSSCF